MPQGDWIAIVAFAILALAIAAAWRLGTSTRARRAWGINMKPPRHCPCCDERLSVLRMPTSLRQFFLGGWICRSCGAEIDKWGGVAN